MFHNWMIKILLSEGGLDKSYINQEKKTISFGLYSIGKMFFEPKHIFACQVLEKWYDYKFYETKFEFRIVNPVSTEKENSSNYHDN